ncbi:MAG: response regulator transcription factor [Chloroflexota bacterium]|nr:response regulator transcription factor [Chloroflexota bacterium]MDE2960484.1 response regulator transcription factor [Chloroflexota bacterium]
MITYAGYQPTSGAAPRVLLLGQGWDMIKGALAAASDAGAIELIGPEASYDADANYGADSPAVLLLSPDADVPAHPDDDAGPPVLRCVPDDELDDPDLYDDLDDFVAVPCSPAELIKRILRLANRHAATSVSSGSIRVGGILLNPATYQVTANGRPVDLAWLEFQLLQFLMDNVGKVFTRDQLLASVWGVENIGGTRTVDVHIRRLRYKLESGPETYFRTVKNVGYGMVEP